MGSRFTTTTQQNCYSKIKPWLEALCTEEPLVEHEEHPIFVVPLGSAAAAVEIQPWGETDTVIAARAYVATNVELTPELMHFLLLQNSQMSFGAFSLDEAGDIRFEYAIIGSTCDELELITSVKTVLEMADAYDDHIIDRWGGYRAIDRTT